MTLTQIDVLRQIADYECDCDGYGGCNCARMLSDLARSALKAAEPADPEAERQRAITARLRETARR